jgi:hypothetical protein
VKIDWQRCVLNLRAVGLSCATIARKIGRNESVVQRIARGETGAWVRFEDGIALLDLHFELCKERHDRLLLRPDKQKIASSEGIHAS